jgi:two-component system sensor histidine kinase EvgS
LVAFVPERWSDCQRNGGRIQIGITVAFTPESWSDSSGICNGQIRLLITDVIMPEMNGKDLSERIQVFAPRMKTLYMSGYTADVISKHGVLENGVLFLTKPFSPLELAKKVKEVLRAGNHQ